jgi:hypothetical protein
MDDCENKAYLVKVILTTLWVVDGGLITIMAKMTSCNKPIAAYIS